MEYPIQDLVFGYGAIGRGLNLFLFLNLKCMYMFKINLNLINILKLETDVVFFCLKYLF